MTKKTDEELKAAVDKAVDALNEAILAAEDAGICVHIGAPEYQFMTVGKRYPRGIVAARLTREL